MSDFSFLFQFMVEFLHENGDGMEMSALHNAKYGGAVLFLPLSWAGIKLTPIGVQNS